MNRDAEMPCPSDRFSADHDGFNKSLVQPTRLSFFPPLVLMMMAIGFTLYSAALTRRGGGNAVFVHRGIWVFHAAGLRE